MYILELSKWVNILRIIGANLLTVGEEVTDTDLETSRLESKVLVWTHGVWHQSIDDRYDKQRYTHTHNFSCWEDLEALTPWEQNASSHKKEQEFLGHHDQGR